MDSRSHPEVFCEKVSSLGSATLSKRDSSRCTFLRSLQNFSEHLWTTAYTAWIKLARERLVVILVNMNTHDIVQKQLPKDVP